MGVMDEAELFEPASLEEWSSWLERHHAVRRGVWLVTAKRSTGRQPFDYEDAVVEALRFGWIDATQRTLDEERSMLWFAPRNPRSGWSGTNKARIERLVAEGRLEPAGRAAVEVAQANGSWSLLDDVEALVVPDDLAVALEAAGVRERWEAMAPSRRRQHLLALAQAKRPDTRARRVEAAVADAAPGGAAG
ncbi:YdeI/OmpD-associated family protein [Nocardioides caldifontis]|uniref:YdeI/OmpD-associated family protein n=1 Tax=Nocardioides caldifontis TaxID=2588938 RepID=UPI0011DF64F0|nr:YdeI/OmpD-associated family protein [Nocardioides caldifontis]